MNSKQPRKQCVGAKQGYNNTGSPCRDVAKVGSIFCWRHDPDDPRDHREAAADAWARRKQEARK